MTVDVELNGLFRVFIELKDKLFEDAVLDFGVLNELELVL